MDDLAFWDTKWTACERVLTALLHDEGEAPPDRIATRILLSRLLDCALSVSALKALNRSTGEDHALDSMCLVRVDYQPVAKVLPALEIDSVAEIA